MKIFRDPRVAMAVSMAVFGTIGFFVRNISVSSGELALYSAVLAAPSVTTGREQSSQSRPAQITSMTAVSAARSLDSFIA